MRKGQEEDKQKHAKARRRKAKASERVSRKKKKPKHGSPRTYDCNEIKVALAKPGCNQS